MKKEKLTHRPAAKVFAFVLIGLCIPAFLACVIGAVFMWENHYYESSYETVITTMFRDISSSDADNLIYSVAREELRKEKEPDTLYRHEDAIRYHNAAYLVKNAGNKELFKSETYDDLKDTPWQFQTVFLFRADPFEVIYAGMTLPAELPRDTSAYTVTVRIDPALKGGDAYSLMYRVTFFLYSWRYAVYIVGFAVFLTALLAFIFLMYAAGHHPGQEAPSPGAFARIPFDLLSVILGGICLFLTVFVGATISSRIPELLFAVAATDAAILLFIFWCTQLAVHVKCGGWWKDTVICRLWRLICRVVRFCAVTVWGWLKMIPLIPKTVLIVAGFSFFELLTQLYFDRDTGARMFFWMLLHAAFGIAVLTVAMWLRRLQKGGEALASGDLSYQTPAGKMLPVFRQHAVNLNSIADGMQKAVAQQMKSERMKTELITNVSHDIKTPLTSIINYIGLLKEPHTPEQEQEYIEVLDRQSHRLKKLTEDLVEASNASSGNMEVHSEKQSMNELLRQAIGEHQDRLEQVPLETIVSMPKETVSACVDGKLMWRVLDNLLNNVCKYALPGTRCYVELENADSHATIRMKNISKERMNIPADELTERFVRGDTSRAGEGSGLGLHISKSLTELMGGVFLVTADGDLFKTEVAFPITQ